MSAPTLGIALENFVFVIARLATRRVVQVLLCAGLAGAAVADTPTDLYSEAMLAIADGRLGDAEKALSQLTATEPQHAGALLDLATLFCAAGKAEAAERIFVDIEQRFDLPPAIGAVIEQLRRLGCHGWQAKTTLLWRLGRGRESNANQGSSNPFLSFGSGSNSVQLVLLPQYQPQGDEFTSLSAEYSRELSPQGATGAVQFQTRAYDRLSNYSTSSLLVSAEQPWFWGDWRFRGAGSVGVMTLDGALYLTQSQVQLEALAPLPLPANWQLRLSESVNWLKYPNLSSFDAQWWETRGTLAYQNDLLRWQGSAAMVQDRELNSRPGGDRQGVMADLQVRVGLGPKLLGELGWQWQRWRGERDYSPGLIDVQREQHTRTIRAAVTYPLGRQQSWVLEFKDTVNYENVSVFDFRNRMLQVTWQWHPKK